MRNRPFISFALLSLASTAISARANVVEYFANAEADRRLDFGDGSDGAFADGPNQPGVTVVGATITFDTSVKNVFDFTSFVLSAGHTLAAVGPLPLVIRSTTTATIAGTIHLDGTAGGAALAAAPGAGGLAGAGGGNGGLGGKQPAGPIDGANAAPRVGMSIGGGGGPNDPAISGQREGGGGCHGPGATGGALYPASAAVCPFTFVQAADGFEAAYFLPAVGALAGGGGGGGGGTRNLNAANAMNGAGGGGAGGALSVAASGDVTVSGTITANGGGGGNGQIGTSDYGASGGGGSGGSIWLQSAARVAGAGTLTVAPGVGGQDPFVASVGGTGSRGVVRIDATTPAFAGAVTPGGAADRVYNVFPVTVEFGISAGPACGTLSRSRNAPEGLRDFLANALAWFGLYLVVRRFFSVRPASSSHFRSGS